MKPTTGVLPDPVVLAWRQHTAIGASHVLMRSRSRRLRAKREAARAEQELELRAQVADCEARHWLAGFSRLASQIAHEVRNPLSSIVAETGPGVPSYLVLAIFDPFFSTKPHGTGLGLSVVQRVVAEHGGAIEVQSDHGAHFRILLPLAVRPDGAGAAPLRHEGLAQV